MRRIVDNSYDFAIRYWPGLLIGLLILTFLMRFHWSFRVLAAIVLIGIAFIALAGSFLAFRDMMLGNDSEPNFIRRLSEKASEARERIGSLSAEQQAIEEKIADLKSIREQVEHEGSGKQWGKSLALLKGYEEELAIRSTKLDFYRKSLKSLTELEEKWRQEEHLKELQVELEQLRKPDALESAQMESLREELAYEKKLLTTYRSLSKELDKTDSLQGAQKLRVDLDRLLE